MGSTRQKLSQREISAAIKRAVKKDTQDRKQAILNRKRLIAEQVESTLQLACDKGDMLSELDRSKICKQATCNHRKGGMVTKKTALYGQDGQQVIAHQVVFPTQGTDHQFAIIKHQMMNLDIWVHCLRCGKWWKPPIRSQYTNETQFILACVEYQKAVEFPTNNVMSGSVLVRFTKPGGSEKYRKLVSNS